MAFLEIADVAVTPALPSDSQDFNVAGSVKVLGLPFYLPSWVGIVIQQDSTEQEQLAGLATGGKFSIDVAGGLPAGSYKLQVKACPLPVALPIATKEVDLTVAGGGGGGGGETFTVDFWANAGGVISPSGYQTYTKGTAVPVAAIPNTGYKFLSWGGDLTGSKNPTNITVNSNMTVIANFTPVSGQQAPQLQAGWNNNVPFAGATAPLEQQIASISLYVIRVWVYRGGTWLIYDPTDPTARTLMGIDYGEAVDIDVSQACTWTEAAGS